MAIKTDDKMKVYLLIQQSNVDGEMLYEVTPCLTFEKAKEEMHKKVNELITESETYKGVDLEMVGLNVDDNGFTIEQENDSFYIACDYDDYSEYLEIIEKEVL